MKVGDILKTWKEVSKWDSKDKRIVKTKVGEHFGVLISFEQDDDNDPGYGNIINSYGDIVLMDFSKINKAFQLKYEVINETT